MKCPECGNLETSVIDSRLRTDGLEIRRRRECTQCGFRYTTYERTEESFPYVIKSSGIREAFSKEKILNGIRRACEKRPISAETVERILRRVCNDVAERSVKEIASTEIGNLVMTELKKVDDVAYVRFASVYRKFRDVSEFLAEVNELKSDSHGSSKTGP